MPDVQHTHGLTTADVARRYRVSEDKVRSWIAKRELLAVNTSTALCGKPRWVITPEALMAFEKARAGGDTPKPPRRKKRTNMIDYYP
jgi:hypothetical protein